MTFVHFTMRLPGHVILSAAKNLSARPFTEFILSEGEGFRVTTLVCRSFEVWFRGIFAALFLLQAEINCQFPYDILPSTFMLSGRIGIGKPFVSQYEFSFVPPRV
jgi:hypothetical protein